jgi:hypothetical protein
MPLPGNLTTVTVTARYVDTLGAPYAGAQVVFSPQATLTDRGEDVFVSATPVKATLDAAGELSVALAATNDPDVEPVGWVWTVREAWEGGREWSFALPESLGPTVDLTDLVPT